jgi:hypothetical protein
MYRLVSMATQKRERQFLLGVKKKGTANKKQKTKAL